MNVKFIYRWRTVEITDDPSSEYDLPVKIIIDGQDRTAVWWLCDRGMPAEEFAKRFIDMEAVLKEAQAAKDADEAKTQFEYKGCQVEITDDLILLDGKDYTPFYKGSNEPPEAWIKGHIDAQARSRLEFQIRDIELKNKAERAETAKKAEEKERTKALEAKIGITLDELKRLPAPARAKLDELIAEKLKASYAAEEAQKVAKAKAAEADRAIREARATEAADEAGKKMASIFREGEKPTRAPIPSPSEWKWNAMLKAYKRRNRISKAVRIVIANILAVPAYALFHRIGLEVGIIARNDRCDRLLSDNPGFHGD